MCGILAHLGPSSPNPEALELALDRLSARGPEGSRSVRTGDALLAHTHLHIVGRQRQPLKASSLVLVSNGEFYDYGPFSGDGEYFLDLWRRRGPEALEEVEGEFAFLLWDGESLWGGRDPFGVKPLHYHQRGQTLVAASEAKALLPFLERVEWDLEALLEASTLQYPLPERTYFRGVRQVPPGHYFRFFRGRLNLQSYHRKRKLVPFPEALERAVKRRFQGDHLPCLQLSGGLDSASIAALAAESQGGLSAYTVSVKNDPLNEGEQARQIADHLGLNWCPVTLTRSQLEGALAAAVAHAEGPAINGHLPAKYLLHRRIAADGHKVVLTGEGADEVLYGYPHFRPLESQARLQPGPSRGTMQLSEEPLELDFWVPNFFHIKARMGRRIAALLHPDLRPPSLVTVMKKWSPGSGSLKESADMWNRSALAQYILKTLGDGTESAHGLEGRPPFLDGTVVRAAAEWEPDFNKGLLRAAMAGRLPSETRQRAKKPFILSPWSRSEFLRQVLWDSPLVNRRALEAKVWSSEIDEGLWDPALMWLATASLLGRAYRL